MQLSILIVKTSHKCYIITVLVSNWYLTRNMFILFLYFFCFYFLVLTINICNYCDTSKKGYSGKEKEKRNSRRNHDFKFSLNPHKVIITNSHLTKHLWTKLPPISMQLKKARNISNKIHKLKKHLSFWQSLLSILSTQCLLCLLTVSAYLKKRNRADVICNCSLTKLTVDEFHTSEFSIFYLSL